VVLVFVGDGTGDGGGLGEREKGIVLG